VPLAHLPFILFMIPTKCRFDTLLFHKYFAASTLSHANRDSPMSTMLQLHCYPYRHRVFIRDSGVLVSDHDHGRRS
jgi:hypothetical protein